jgi:hypothetical protein
MCSLVALSFQCVLCPLFRVCCCRCVVCLGCVVRIWVGVICSNSLYVFFVSCSEVSTCLPNVFEFAIFAVHLVYVTHVVYVCGVILLL